MARKGRNKLKSSWKQKLSKWTLYDYITKLPTTLRRLLLILICLFIIVSYLYITDAGSVLSNKIQHYFVETSISLGFKTDSILIEGRNITAEDSLLKILLPYRGKAILSIDLDKIRNDIKTKIPWVHEVKIKRELPNKLHVILEEVTPLAKWYHKGKHYIVAKEKTIALKDTTPFIGLPLIKGKGANEHAVTLFDTLDSYPEILPHIEKAIRIEGRRWNLVTKNNLTILLPTKDIDNALKKLANYITNDSILERAVTSIDLRLSDRIFIKPIKKP